MRVVTGINMSKAVLTECDISVLVRCICAKLFVEDKTKPGTLPTKSFHDL